MSNNYSPICLPAVASELYIDFFLDRLGELIPITIFKKFKHGSRKGKSTINQSVIFQLIHKPTQRGPMEQQCLSFVDTSFSKEKTVADVDGCFALLTK